MQNNQNNQNTQENTMRTFKPSNIVRLSGILDDDFAYSHSTAGEDFFKSKVRIKRASGVEDYIPVVISRQWMGEKPAEGKLIELEGSFRSHIKIGQDGKGHLELFAFANRIHVCDDISQLDGVMDVNYIYLEGTVCKQPILRQTPFGRTIADLTIAVNSRYGKSSYIPCIAWGRNGYWCEKLEVGEMVTIEGRMQSREYFKATNLETEEGVWRETYEISVFRIDRA